MLENKFPKLVVIVGPTASGKTALSLEVAKRFNGEIVSADSRQIYREMNIGTAKAVPKEKVKSKKLKVGTRGYFVNGIKHHLVNIKNPNQDYSVGEYKKDVLTAIRNILKAGKLPIIVGGTGLYVSAIVNNLEFPEVKENKKLRAKLEKEIKTKGLDFVFKKLVEFDPEAAYIVDPNNPRRVIRAMEVALSTGRPFSAQRKTGALLFDFLQIGLKLLPEKLKDKIQKRTKEMIKNGLVNEVKGLVKKYGPDLPKANRGSSIGIADRDYKPKAFDAIGYREIIDHLKNRVTLKEAEDLINKNTWHYAKRQMTWFKRSPTIHWFDASQKSTKTKIVKAVSRFLLF